MIGRRLRDARASAGLTQALLAQRAGVSRALVSAVEAGRHLPRIDAALALATALDTTAERLFREESSRPVDALSGEPSPVGALVRVGFLGERAVTAAPRWGAEGWETADGIAGESGVELFARPAASVVLAGCEPGLVLLERLLREHGTQAVAITASSAAALEALGAGRLHAAVVHFRAGSPPSFDLVPTVRLRFARWQVGLAARRNSRRHWWESALGGRVEVVQREPGAGAQQAFERAARTRGRAIRGPRVASHLEASRRALASGIAAVSIEPAARAVGAAFHPLETHEVELWIRAERVAEPGVERLLSLLTAAPFRRMLESVGGYDLSRSGSRVA